MDVFINAFRYLVKEDRKSMIEQNQYPTSFLILNKNLNINKDDILNSLSFDNNIQIKLIINRDDLIVIKILDEFIMIRIENIDGKPRNIHMVKYKYEYQKDDAMRWII